MKLVAILTVFAAPMFGASEGLTVEKLAAALGIEVSQIADFSKYRVPEGTIEFASAGPSPMGLWRGQVLYGEHRSVPIWVRLRTAGGSVERGSQVRVEVTSGGALVAFDALAESSGHAGDSVIIRNPENGRRFSARVVGDGKVSVKK